MNNLLKEKLEKSISYTAYRALVEKLVDDGKTTGPNQSPFMVHYTLMNHKRMQRLDKTTKILEDWGEVLQASHKRQIWLVITEAWCGDAAQIIPVLHHIAQLSDRIDIRFVFRDEHPELMDEYLTGGSRSIPKVISVDPETYEELGVWGPRPEEVQEMVMAHKANPAVPYEELAKETQLWYAKDKTLSTQVEFLATFKTWAV